MLTAIQMTTVAARLRKPHSPYVAEAAADALDDLAKSQTALVNALGSMLVLYHENANISVEQRAKVLAFADKTLKAAALALAEPK